MREKGALGIVKGGWCGCRRGEAYNARKHIIEAIVSYIMYLELQSQPVVCGCLVLSNHSPCKDLVHHPTERTMYKWLL